MNILRRHDAQISNVNNCQTVAEFAVRLKGKGHGESTRRFAIVADKFSSVDKDSVALYLYVSFVHCLLELVICNITYYYIYNYYY